MIYSLLVPLGTGQAPIENRIYDIVSHVKTAAAAAGAVIMKPGGSPGLIPLLYAQEFAAHGAIRSLGKPEKAERKTQMQNMHPNVRARRPTMSEHEAGAFRQERVGLAIYMRKSGMAERRFCHAFIFW